MLSPSPVPASAESKFREWLPTLGQTSAWLSGALLALSLAAGCKPGPKRTDGGPTPTGTGSAGSAAPTCDRSAGAVSRDRVLTRSCSPYVFAETLRVQGGATLKIDPGVEIRFAKAAGLDVGVDGQAGRLVAEGTEDLPIVLRADGGEAPGSESNASWAGLRFQSHTLPGSVLAYAGISDAGVASESPATQPASERGCVTVIGVKHGALRIAYVQLEHCAVGGLLLSESAVQLGPMKFARSPAGFVADAQSTAALPVSIQYVAVPLNVITGGTVSDNTVWSPQGRPYLVRGDVTVGGAAGPALILQPGVELRFRPNIGLSVGTSAPGILKAMGSKASPVLLRSEAEPGAADQAWRGVRFGAEANAGNSLDFSELSGAGPEGAVRVDTSPKGVTIQDTLFANNQADIVATCRSEPELKRVRMTSKRGLIREGCR